MLIDYFKSKFNPKYFKKKKKNPRCDDAPPNSLIDSTTSPKVKTMEGKGIGVCSLVHSISKVERCVGALGWGLGRTINESIIHMDLHKPNNKLIIVYLKHYWCMNEPHVHTNSQNSPQLGFRGSHHLPPYNIIYD
jgi:hypothetical protein